MTRRCQFCGHGPAVVFDLDGSWCSEACRVFDEHSDRWRPRTPANLAFEAASDAVFAAVREGVHR